MKHQGLTVACSDVMLVVEGAEIPAHRVVLSNYSQYFSQMFADEGKDSKEDKDSSYRVVQIDDISRDTFTQVLRSVCRDCAVLSRLTGSFTLVQRRRLSVSSKRRRKESGRKRKPRKRQNETKFLLCSSCFVRRSASKWLT